MDKKDIYEHLAKIYLDTTPAASRKKPAANKNRKRYFFVAIPFVVGIGAFLLLVSFRGHPLMPAAQTSMVLAGDSIKFNFNLDAAKKQVYSLDLKSANLNGYKTLAFSVRDSNYHDAISCRVEFTNAYREKGEIYFTGISDKWKEFRLALADFKTITDWSEVSGLSFAIEEWNTRDNKGILFIDDVRLLK